MSNLQNDIIRENLWDLLIEAHSNNSEFEQYIWSHAESQANGFHKDDWEKVTNDFLEHLEDLIFDNLDERIITTEEEIIEFSKTLLEKE